MSELHHGASVAGYRIEALIGHGSTGFVYSAEDVSLQRRVALKVLLPELARDERYRERFLRESRLAAALEHPHIVPVHAVGESEGLLYLAMRYVGDRDLAGLIKRAGRLEAEHALRICGHLASALDAAHANGLVHRDVKPGNVLLARTEEGDYAYLCDFGLAKHGATVTSLTGARAIVGTVGYLSPEQIEGLPVDGRTDVYALGCVLFECLTGAPPFMRDNELATILAHKTEPPPPLGHGLPAALDGVMARALAKDRDLRYATCGELIRDGRRALAGEAPEAPALHTFVFADIRGYTSYTREHGDEAGARLAQRFAALVEPLAREHGGTVPQLRGDEALVVFDSARAALRFALALQRRVTQDDLPRGVGIGLDAGEAVAVEDGFRGGALNRAARLCAVAAAGEVLASDGVTHLAGEVGGVRYGLHRHEKLKGFQRPVGAVEVHTAEAAPRRQLRRRAARAVRGHVRPLAAAATIAVAVAVAAIALGGGHGASAASFTPNSIAMVNARTGAPIGTVAPGLHICVFAAAGRDLWACDADQSILLRISAVQRRVIDEVPLPVYHGSFAVGFGSVWVGDVASTTVRRVDPRFRTSSPPIRLPHVPASSNIGIPENVTSMVTTRNAVWATYGFPKRVARIDPETGRVTFDAALHQDCPCDALLAAGGGRLWAVGGDGSHLYRLDPHTGRTLATGRLHGGDVVGAAVAGGYLWVGIKDDGAVWKIDETGATIDKVPTGAQPSDVEAADGYIWVANAGAGTVTRIDPRTNAVRTYRVGHQPLAVAEIGGTLFVGLGQSAAEAAAGLGGKGVVRALVPGLFPTADPVSYGGPPDLALGTALGAGLMAVHTGTDGRATIAPELARDAPAVSPDGRAYTFELRPRLRFSNGQPLTTAAVRYSIERAVAPTLVNHYCRDLVLNDLAGQAAYEAGRAPHIAGLRAEGDRIVLTLARPSPTLPARLANPCLSVVPDGTPEIPVGLNHPIPSAGPFYAASITVGQQIVLRRNLRYGGRRPAHVDAVILRGDTNAQAAGAAVERGRADYAADQGAPPSPDFQAGGRYDRAYGKPGRPLRLFRPASGLQRFLLFNTRRGIFSSAALRRAVNLALDRRAIAGPGVPESLLIPPGVPGHRARQVYGAAPDLRRARALARGHGGPAVLAVSAGGPPDPSVGEIRADLARIGVRLEVRRFANPSAAASDPRQRIDAVMGGWAPDYLDPFDVVNVLLDPSARLAGFPNFFDDPRWVRRMHAAAGAPLARRDAVYAKLDADLARGPAPFAVLASPPGLSQLISSRLGCLAFTAYQGILDPASVCLAHRAS